MATIIPTVGRKVWFFEDGSQVEPIDATVIKVWESEVWASVERATPQTAVNLDCVDPLTGQHYLRSSVIVSDVPIAGRHFRWMPYQLAQAAKQ